jgi:hypothetical protein
MSVRWPARLPAIAGTALAVAGTALAVAACGSGSGSPSTTTHTATAPPTSSAATTTSTANTSTVTATSTASSTTRGTQPTAVAASTACASGDVSVSLGRASAGLGHLGQPLLFENVGPSACSLTGYPGVALVRTGGRQLQVRRAPNGYLGGLSPNDTSNPVVHLRPDQTASALVEGEDSSRSGGACPSYAALLVTPPNQRVTSRIDHALAICDPQVHPVVAGTSGRQS